MADAFVECLREAAGHATAGRTDDAIACYRAALDLDPGNPGVFHNLGVLVAARGDALPGLRSDERMALLEIGRAHV